MIEDLFISLVGVLIQSSKGTRSIYFLLMTVVHKPFYEIILQIDFALSADANLFSCLMHPPLPFLRFGIEV